MELRFYRSWFLGDPSREFSNPSWNCVSLSLAVLAMHGLQLTRRSTTRTIFTPEIVEIYERTQCHDILNGT